jgi:hypothetical protein
VIDDRHRRILTLALGVRVGFRELRLSPPGSRYLRELAQAQREEGVFLGTDRPPAAGAILALELDRPAGTRCRVVAVVRWRICRPRLSGMAVDVLDLGGLSSPLGNEWLAGPLLEVLALGEGAQKVA